MFAMADNLFCFFVLIFGKIKIINFQFKTNVNNIFFLSVRVLKLALGYHSNL